MDTLGENYTEEHAGTAKFLIEQFGEDFNFDDLTWTSPPTYWEENPAQVYNCFGYVLDSRKHWQPSSILGDIEGDPRYHWPDELRGKGNKQNTFVQRYVEAAK